MNATTFQMAAFQVYTTDNNQTVGTFRLVMDASKMAQKIGLDRVSIRMVMMDEATWNAMA